MKKYILHSMASLCLALFFTACERGIEATVAIDCDHPYADIIHPKGAAYQAILDDYVKQGLPGISLLVEDSTGVYVGSAGKADIENNIDYTPCHISKAASITKLFVGTLALMLEEEGKLSLDDPIEEYIDGKTIEKIENAAGKTIGQLMNHSTGIFDVITSSTFYLAVLNNPNKDWTQEDLLKFVYGEPGVALTNTYPAQYSNTNTLLLTMCIEKATGIPHTVLLKNKILDPLQMTDTYYQGREAIPSDAAQGYFDLHNNNTIVNVSNLITGSGNGYGGIYANVFDLHRFIKALFVDKTLLGEASLAKMYETLREDEDFYCGAGTIKKFTMKSAYGIGHTGRDLGYSANLFYFPDNGKIITFFVNYGTNGESALRPVFRAFESDITDAVLE